MKLSVRIETDDGQVLEFSEADTVSWEFSTPYDVVTLPEQPGDKYVRRELGTPRFKLDAAFSIGNPPRWTEKSDG